MLLPFYASFSHLISHHSLQNQAKKMQLDTLLTFSPFPNNSHFQRLSHHSLHFPRQPAPSNFTLSSQTPSPQNRRLKLLLTACVGNVNHLKIRNENTSSSESISLFNDDDVDEDEEEAGSNSISNNRQGALANHSIWAQMKEIVIFSGPATGLWICAPLMSLISTAVVGRRSSTELAALGPGTVFCDNMNLLFMFLSIATSNMVATSLAKGDEIEVQHQISILLFVGFVCGALMLVFTQFIGSRALAAFTGPENVHIVPAASKYVQIRGLAWPAVLYGLVAQSASLGMKDSWGPLKALVIASVVNGIGHVILCSFLRYGIEGAAWATMASQIIAAFMMIEELNRKGYNTFAISVPSFSDFLQIFRIAAPVFVTMFSKVAFYSLITYFATAIGTHTVAAHQVMIQMYSMCVAWGEPLSQTALSFMPELLYGFNRSLEKARILLKSLMIIGALLGLVIGLFGMSVPWLLPNIFTPDLRVIQEMHSVLILFFIALSVAPCTHSLEGTLLAGRELTFISLTMGGCFSLGALLLLVVSSRGYGLRGCWCVVVGFQWARFFLALRRLFSPSGMLYSEEGQRTVEKLKAA